MNNKQSIYGFFFLLIAVGLIFGIYQLFFRSTGSCTDGIQNQNEEKIDCGGGCTPCEISALEELRVTKEPKVMPIENSAVSTFEILNPNRDYDAPNFPYTLLIYESGGRLVEEISGDASVRALRRTLILQGGIKTSLNNIGRIEVRLGEPEWEKSFSELIPAISLSSDPVTSISSSSIRVLGKLKNEGSVSEQGVEVIAILADKYGKELFASRSVLSTIPARGERDFSVAFPASEMLIKLTDPSRTKITIQVEY